MEGQNRTGQERENEKERRGKWRPLSAGRGLIRGKKANCFCVIKAVERTDGAKDVEFPFLKYTNAYVSVLCHMLILNLL